MTGLTFMMSTRPYLDSSDSNTAKKANYVLQTYWRDMTSGLEFAGPHFLKEVPLDGKFLHDILFQVNYEYFGEVLVSCSVTGWRRCFL